MKKNRIMMTVSFTWLVIISSAIAVSPYSIEVCDFNSCRVSFGQSLQSSGLLMVGLITMGILGFTLIKEFMYLVTGQKQDTDHKVIKKEVD